MNFDFTPVWDNIPTLVTGTGYTLLIALFAAIISLVGGLAVALTTLYGKKIFSYPLRFFIWLFMGTPLLLQLYLLYFTSRPAAPSNSGHYSGNSQTPRSHILSPAFSTMLSTGSV